VDSILPGQLVRIGRLDEAIERSNDAPNDFARGLHWPTVRAWAEASSGHHERATAGLEGAVRDTKLDSGGLQTMNSTIATILETAVVLNDLPLVARLEGMVTNGSERFIFSVGFASVARVLGDSAVLLGRLDDARQRYNEALLACDGLKARPETAMTRFHLAELLLDHYPDEHAEAIEHLDFAINEFREMKMQPSLTRAMGHKQVEGA
jgi:hypothetical protein